MSEAKISLNSPGTEDHLVRKRSRVRVRAWATSVMCQVTLARPTQLRSLLLAPGPAGARLSHYRVEVDSVLSGELDLARPVPP